VRRRQRGRTAPFNGSVTRADIHAIHREFIAEPVEPPPTVDEFVNYLVGAIQDRPITALARRRMSIAKANYHARRRAGPTRVLAPGQHLG
jgi:hypothetical protein